MIRTIIFILLFNFSLCKNIHDFFDKINEDVVNLNAIAAEIAWNRGTEYSRREAKYQLQNIIWYRKTCATIGRLHHNYHLLNKTQERQAYLLCRGPKFTFSEARGFTTAYNELQEIYSNAKICIPDPVSNGISVEESILNFISSIKKFVDSKQEQTSVRVAANFNHGLCLVGDVDFEKMMKSKNDKVLEWIWLGWREKFRTMKSPFAKLVAIENKAAGNNHYNNIGEVWWDEVEVPNLRQLSRELYESVRPLYELVHGVVRYFLRKKYGDIVPERGLIPTHLLGSLWPQNWEPLAQFIIHGIIDLDSRIKNLNWTVDYMMERAEDFYVSLSLPALPDEFWQNSVLSRHNKSTKCLGAAADMYNNDDVRISYCSGTDFQDFRVLHHELGHVQYFMAYKRQPGIFRQANSMLHESIGDAIMYGVMTPQHLNRLRLINDAELYNKERENDDINSNKEISEKSSILEDNKEKGDQKENEVTKDFSNLYPNIFNNDSQEIQTEEIDDIDVMILLKQILYKLPQIPYSFLIDEYRWRYFEGSLNEDKLNKEFWMMVKDFMGVAPPGDRNEEYFDVGAELHVADNTPFSRYFLSSFIQHQIFESLCKASVFGRNDQSYKLPASIPLHRCDIYGSKVAGKMLKDLMSRGHSQHWQEILSETIGEDEISDSSLQRYYRPLISVLLRLVKQHQIPLGW
ncbi:angiotensin-converting enzyme-like [Aricia agestis]|uniref:angiotensin-converting enzyme-like n=1 Tax=Aricia agestis TaxID=91739 RepID=UPI001C202BE3|nr:angiotensin-converting enzyme-like [Aricia agestis]XP_041987998.1 angiotensin-converting enzyme-like [Aricia agestis]